ncbi:hypothetical protein GALMADRAFT_1199674 [Galerina marginata CBS 339.88]|uniref:F-box domain-containing protein n=1 Tax=Galerina marginata (strain CBS 339.88) TaxID=685588 RepID=A0A067TBE7_GALM3|nr:hypothetical protein GALMADRAFT_1199674 [Galerina marginata CBS 339.88]
MQPSLSKFLENNDSPPEGVLKEVRDLLSNPLQDLQSKDKELERLDKALKHLQKERDTIQESINEYATILSPIRRIPSDILHEIFYHCLSTHRNPIMSITEAPLLLTRICGPWRTMALSSHRIWSKLHIPLLPFSVVNYSPPPHPPGADTSGMWESRRESADKYARTMRARCRLADIWLSRSGSCPLSISIKLSGGLERVPLEDLPEEHPMLHAFRTILSFSYRFTELELSMPTEIYDLFQNRISLDTLPRLRKLRMNLFRRTTHRGLKTMMKPVLLLQVPNLQNISFHSRNFTAFDPKGIPPTWESLTNLIFHFSITSADAFHVLRRCRNLERCKFIISVGTDVYISSDEELSLLRLRSLSIHVGGTDSMLLFCRQINAPILDSFNYQHYNRFPRSYSDDSQASFPPSPFLSLLESCNHMKKLSFDPHILTAHDILFSFRFANQLTHLILGQRPYGHNANSSHYDSDEYYLKSGGGFHLNLLITETSGADKEVLLPNLEVFEAYLGTSFSDESLQQFILSRLGDPSRNGVSALRAVKVIFNRRREMDITEEVYRHAKTLGLKIELDLCYVKDPLPPVTAKYTDIFSPWYGLTSDDRSWNFATDTDDLYT